MATDLQGYFRTHILALPRIKLISIDPLLETFANFCIFVNFKFNIVHMLPKVIFSSLQANLYSLHWLLKGQTLRSPWRCSQVPQATLRRTHSEVRRGTCLMQLQLQWRRNSPVSATVNGSWPHITRNTLHAHCTSQHMKTLSTFATQTVQMVSALVYVSEDTNERLLTPPYK